MSDPEHPRYATVAQVKLWAPYSDRDFTDSQVPDVIESATREVIALTRKEWDPLVDAAYDDIEIITSYLTGSMIQGSLGNLDAMKGFRDMALSKLRSLMSSGGGPGQEGVPSDTINVFSSPTSYYLAKSKDVNTTIKPFKSIR